MGPAEVDVTKMVPGGRDEFGRIWRFRIGPQSAYRGVLGPQAAAVRSARPLPPIQSSSSSASREIRNSVYDHHVAL